MHARIVLLAVLVLPLQALAVEPAPDPLTLFRDAVKRVESAPAFSVHVEKRFDVVSVDGAKLQYGGAMDLVVRRSGGLHVDYGDDLSAKEAWYDGETLTLLDHLHNVFVAVPMQGSVGEALVRVNERYDVDMPLAPLLERKLSGEIDAVVLSSRYLGIHDAESIPCHHLLFRGPENDLQVWVSAGDEPLLRKLVVTFRGIEGVPQQDLLFSDWDLAPEIDPTTFRAELPEGAIRTEFAPREGD